MTTTKKKKTVSKLETDDGAVNLGLEMSLWRLERSAPHRGEMNMPWKTLVLQKGRR
jgi:hypothetical protein